MSSQKNEVALHLTERAQEVYDIDTHVNDYLTAKDAAAAQGTAALAKFLNLQRIYQGARPVLKFLRAVTFFKPKWQHVIDDLIIALDALYSVTGE